MELSPLPPLTTLKVVTRAEKHAPSSTRLSPFNTTPKPFKAALESKGVGVKG